MADYWKSLPKKYCDFCKCWFADNKASVDFHERGFRHQNNVKRKLQDLQRSGAKKEKEEMKYNIEMMKIEAMAMKSFQSDVSKRPELAKELSTNNLMFKKLETSASSSSRIFGSRFGEESSAGEESTVLVRGRERALETIAKKFEKKSKWLERKTAEGKTFYWNRETLDTKWEAPKSGFLSLEEQKHCPEVNTEGAPFPTNQVNPYGRWQTISNVAFDEKMPDLQLPGQQLPEIVAPVVVEYEKEPKMEFKEKTMDSVKRKPFPKTEENVSFKKRKNDPKRNVRQRTDD